MTDRISSFQSSPSTTFTLEADVVETVPSFGDHGRWRLRFYLRAKNGPGGTAGSQYLGAGSQTGRRSAGSVWNVFGTHSGNPFLPSGYADEAQRWRDGPTDQWVNANDNGYWHTSLTSMPLQMSLVYGAINTTLTGSVPIPRIPRAPGAAGTPSMGAVTASTAAFSWTAAVRGNANITRYEYQYATTADFASPIGGTHNNGLSLSASVSGLSAVTGYYLRVRAVNGDGNGAWSGSRSFTTAPNAPSAPTIGTPARVSDGQQTVNWTRVASGSAPYASQQVQRRVFNGSWGAWTGVATIGTAYTTNGAQSWSDTGTTGNRIYQYQVKASNASGEATSGASVNVYTTPGAPASVVAAKNATGGVVLTLVHTVAHTAVDTVLEYSTNGGSSWSSLTSLNGAATSYTWASPPTENPLMFRARVVVDHASQVGNGLTSAWRTSNTVQLLAPPNAPSSLNPNGVVYDGDTARVFTWQHNPVDSSPQSKYQIRYREVGDGWTEGSQTTSASSAHEFASFPNGEDYEWAVRTWGLHADPSPWSATAVFTTSTPPVVAVTEPGEEHTTSTLVVEWSYFDEEATAQSAWESDLTRDSVVVEARSGSGAATTTTFTTRLDDATTYTVRVRGRDGSGLWSEWDAVTFTTDFLLPPQPSVQLTWDPDTGAVNITVGNPEAGEGEAEPDHNTVYRSVDGITWVLLDEDVALSSTITDRTVPFQEVFYKAVTWSTLPSASESEVEPFTPPATDVYWSGGDGLATVMRITGGLGEPPKVDLTQGLLTRVLHYFAGRTLPVEAAGTQRSRTGTVSFVTLTQPELDTVRTLSYLPAPHLIRTPDGITLYCSIGPVEENRVIDDMYEISFNVAEVEQ